MIASLSEKLLHAEDDELIYCSQNSNNSNINQILDCKDFWRKRYQLKFGIMGDNHFERCTILHSYIDYYMHYLYGNRKYNLNCPLNLPKTFENIKKYFQYDRCSISVKYKDDLVHVIKRRLEYNYVTNIKEFRTEIEFYILKDGGFRIKGCKSPQELEHFYKICVDNIVKIYRNSFSSSNQQSIGLP